MIRGGGRTDRRMGAVKVIASEEQGIFLKTTLSFMTTFMKIHNRSSNYLRNEDGIEKLTPQLRDCGSFFGSSSRNNQKIVLRVNVSHQTWKQFVNHRCFLLPFLFFSARLQRPKE